MNRIIAAAGVFLFSATLAVAAQPGSPEYIAKVSPQLTAQMSKAAGPVSAIVTLWDQEITKPSLGELRFEKNIDDYVAEADRTVDEALRVAGIATPKHRYHTFAGFAADLSPYQIERLVDSPLVRMISPDWKMDLHRKEGNALMNVPAVHSLGKKGAGVSVAIIDDGVYWAHPELGGGTTFPNGLVIGGYDFIDDVSDPSPAFDNSAGEFQTHGTSVAGIIAGQGDPSTGSTGVAPQAKIVAFRASSGSQVLAAYDYIATRTFNPAVKVLNMSFAFDSAGYFAANCDSEPGFEGFKAALDRLNALGIVLVASSGNEAKTDGVALPGCMSKVVAVGAVYDANIGGVAFGGDGACQDTTTAADKVTCYSNSSSFVALLGPSHNCRTTKAGPGSPYFDDFGGTSAAAPYASGAFAVLMSSFPGRTPAQYRDIFKSTGKQISDAKSGRSTARIDLNAAYQSLAGGGGGGTKSNGYIIPASARVQGGGAFYQTDVRIFNKTATTANVDMYLMNANDNSTASGVGFTVNASQVKPIDDIIGQALGLGSGIGALLFLSDQPLVITSDTYALSTCVSPSGGTLGQFIPAVAVNKGGTTQRVYHVINDSRFYTNFGVFNASTSAATVNVTVRSGTGGTLGTTKSIPLGPLGWTQVSKIVDNVGGGSTSNAYIDVTSNVPVITYTSVVDRKTSDPFYVAGESQ